MQSLDSLAVRHTYGISRKPIVVLYCLAILLVSTDPRDNSQPDFVAHGPSRIAPSHCDQRCSKPHCLIANYRREVLTLWGFPAYRGPNRTT